MEETKIYSTTLNSNLCCPDRNQSKYINLSTMHFIREHFSISDMWLTVHRNSVWITNQLDITFVQCFIFSFISCPKHVEQLIKEKIKHYTKVTSSWFVIHTDFSIYSASCPNASLLEAKTPVNSRLFGLESVWRKWWREKSLPLLRFEPITQHVNNLLDTVSWNSQMSY